MKFIVRSGVPYSELDVETHIRRIPKILKKSGLKNVYVKKCYCCEPPDFSNLIMEFEAQNERDLYHALEKIDLPIESIEETSEVTLRIHKKNDERVSQRPVKDRA
ncbi:hypothetical protein [[Eubacterium] cellulosolvens]